MKHLQKQLLLEQIIYLSIWVLILGTPLIGFLLDNDHPLEGSELWKEVSDTWLMVLPFFLLFLIHNYVLIPRLLLKKYYTRYVLFVDFYHRYLVSVSSGMYTSVQSSPGIPSA